MERREVYVVYSTRHRNYFGGVQFNLPLWVNKLNDSYWFLTKEKAESVIKEWELPQCEVQRKVAVYPDVTYPYIENN